MSFRLLVYHEMPEFAKKELESHGIEIVRGTQPSEDTICREIADCDGLVAFEQPEHGFGKVIIDAAPRLKLIARRGVGYETVDVGYAEEKGIFVTNTPAVNSRTVAEAAIMLMLECARNAQKISERFRREKKEYRMFTSDVSARGIELTGRVLGVIGCGNIGRNVAQIAAQGFGMKVLGYDAYTDKMPDYIERVESMEEVFEKADFISLHLPSTEETRHSIGEEQFNIMKPSAFLINTSRGDVIRERDLIDALEKGRIRGAGLDVFSSEPISEESYPLFEMERVVMTPHCASFTVESLNNAVQSVVRSVLETAAGSVPSCVVNHPLKPRNMEEDKK